MRSQLLGGRGGSAQADAHDSSACTSPPASETTASRPCATSVLNRHLQRFQRLAKQNIHLTVTDGTTRFDPVFGARPLKRAIQKHLLDLLVPRRPRRRLQRRPSHHCGDQGREAGV
ncbi:MAG: hypothetical protein IPK22_20055 [Verrucomicrobiaceae bacterium]|nr:hypothetical protein [Verrucomicrobiaceae bacterium]